MFIYFQERQRQRASGRGAEREGDQNPKQLQALSCQHGARPGARTHKPRDHDLNRSWVLNQLSHPGTPGFHFSWADPWIGIAGRMVPVSLTKGLPDCSPQWLHQSVCSPAGLEGSSFLSSLSTLIISFLDYSPSQNNFHGLILVILTSTLRV